MWEICYSGNCMPSIPFNIVIELFLNLMFLFKISSLLTLCFVPPILHFHWLDVAAWKAVEPALFIYPTLWNPPQFVKDVAFPEVVWQNRRNQIQAVRDRRWHSNLTKSSKKNIKLAQEHKYKSNKKFFELRGHPPSGPRSRQDIFRYWSLDQQQHPQRNYHHCNHHHWRKVDAKCRWIMERHRGSACTSSRSVWK